MNKRKSTSKSRAPAKKAKKTKKASATISTEDLSVEEATGLAPIWVDHMEIISRGDIPISMLRFFCVITAKKKLEVARLQTSTAHLKGLVNVLCRVLNYIPTKVDIAKSKVS